MKGRRVLITGGAGLVGSHIADLLVSAGAAEIVVLDTFLRGRPRNLSWATAHGPVTLVEVDIRDRDHLTRAMQGIDVVFHQAAVRVTQCEREPRLGFEVLVDGTFNVLEAAVSAGVEKVVAASSITVYGMADAFPTPESHHPYNDTTLYGAAKSFNEGLLRSFHRMYEIDYVVLRYANVYGPRMDVEGKYTEVPIRWMERIEAGRPPVIHGDGGKTLDWVHVRDVARANVLAAESDVSGEVFNVASGVETRLDDLAHLLLRLMGSDLAVEYAPDRDPNAVPRRLADTSRARARLGFVPEIDLETGFRELVEWWRAERRRHSVIGA